MNGKADIGATVSKRFGYAAVVSVIPGGPADKAGINSGDILETVNGESTHDLSLAAVRAKLRGDQGSRLEATIIRTRKIEPQKITIVREVVGAPAITEQLMGDVGISRLSRSTRAKPRRSHPRSSPCRPKVQRRLCLICAMIPPAMKLRGCCSQPLYGNGQIASLKGQKYEPQTFNADPQKKVTDLPLAVLVNRGSRAGGNCGRRRGR